MLGSVGIARQGAHAGKRAGLELGAVAVAERGGRGQKGVQHGGRAGGGEGVAAADARAFLEVYGLGEPVPAEHLVRDRERLPQAEGPARATPADLEKDL